MLDDHHGRRSVAELGGQFQERLFTTSWSQAIAERVPLLVERVIVPDLTLPGLALAATGALWLLRRRTAELETEYMARYPGREVDKSRLTQEV